MQLLGQRQTQADRQTNNMADIQTRHTDRQTNSMADRQDSMADRQDSMADMQTDKTYTQTDKQYGRRALRADRQDIEKQTFIQGTQIFKKLVMSN